MNLFFFNSRPIKKWRLFFYLIFLGFTALVPRNALAHQTPTTVILLDVSTGSVAMELQLPLTELELAFGHDITKNPETVIQKLGPQLKEYLIAHIHPFITPEAPWQVEITGMKMEEAQQPASGPPFREITVNLKLKPPAGVSTRKFTLDYDVIMHQVINHVAFVSVRNDWEAGQTRQDSVEIGVIKWDLANNVIPPLEINLEKGSWWKGFSSMVALGRQHIAEGTDHLMFLLVLLLPAPLLCYGKRWAGYGGARYSVIRLLKIVTAFTIGHSITLLLGATGWLRLPAQPIEILIAFSILVSAVHAIRPLFPGREIYIAAGFGLIHGMAFAGTLVNLNLDAEAMALSILGFNIGIELMQLAVIAVTVPWLIILSRTGVYQFIRVGGAIFAGIAAIAWMLQRYAGEPNWLSTLVEKIAAYAPWIIGGLALLALSSFFWVKPASKSAIVRNLRPDIHEPVNN